MPFISELMRSLHMSQPVIQGPMSGAGDTPALVAAVSSAGGIGTVGAAYMSPTQILETAADVRKRTTRPYGMNLFAPTPTVGQVDARLAIAAATPLFAEVGLDAPKAPALPAFSFADQLAAILETDAIYVSFTFGQLPADAMSAIKAKGKIAIGTASSVSEAKALAESGVDAVIAQGSESGGHRASFLVDFDEGMIGTMALVPQVVDAVKIPVIAAGGIMDGRGIVAAMSLGASAVQMGTAFLTCNEAAAVEAYKQAILDAKEYQTRTTRAFSGRPARGIVNRFMREIDAQAANGSILPFPWQNALTRPMRTAAAKQGQADYLSLWAGQGLGLARRQPAAELMARLAEERAMVLERLSASR